MATVTSDTYMAVDYPRGKVTIGYINESDGGVSQTISMLGGRYRVKDLIESGYTFMAVMIATPERIAALDQALTMAQWYCEEYHDHANGCPDMSPLYAMLAEMKGEAHADSNK